ncbi:transposable element Tcb1 transposase [Trichonephila clavipes]|nr:transposable element Tcb1 transposase [Trichonephila clavipes]
MRRDEGRVVDPPLVFKRVFRRWRRALDGGNLRRTRKKRDLDCGGSRLKGKERKDDERRWRWRIGHPPQCTTSREDRQIVRIAVTNRLVTSRKTVQHIESVTHHSVSARTIRRRLQQSTLSARRPLVVIPMTQYHRRLRRQWCNERRMWASEWNEVVFTDESRICLQHHEGRI